MGTDVKELPEDATPEQIDALAQSFVTPKKTEEETTDSQKIAENVMEATEEELVEEEEQTTASDETPAGEESSDDKKEEVVEEEESEWLTEGLRAEAAALGIDEDQLSEFGSQDELDRAFRLLYRSVLKEGRKSLDGEATEEKSAADDRRRGPDGRFLPRERQQKEAAPEPAAEPSYKVSLDPDEYDEAIVKELEGLRDHYESRLKTFEDRVARFEEFEMQREVDAAQAKFDLILDTLDYGELYGKTGEETSKQLERREKAWSSWEALVIGFSSRGHDLPISKTLLDRVTRMEFPNEVSRKERKALTRKVTKQSGLRMGGGVTRPTETKETTMEYMENLYDELDRSG
jgi:hypothetical protein